MLENHPLPCGKPLVGLHDEGSAGVPDSLGHRPVNTSGAQPVVQVFVYCPVVVLLGSPPRLQVQVSLFISIS